MKSFNSVYDLEKEVSRKILGSYMWMGLGLVITSIIVYLGFINLSVFNFSIEISRFSIFILIGFVFLINGSMSSMNTSILKLVFIIYSGYMGIFLLPFIYMYQTYSILYVLVGTASMFVALSLYGYFTKDNLQGYVKYLFAGLIGIIVLGLLNMFIKSSGLDLLLAIVGLFIFIIYTAVDTQMIKNNIMNAYVSGDVIILKKIQIIGALSLYMDFINLFIRLLALFGRRK